MTGSPLADDIVGDWLHSHEEDEPGRQVFRRRGHPFPPSRGRRGFELAADGEVREVAPGPDDRTRRTTGTWELDGNRLVLRVDGRAPEEFAIDSVEPDRLVLRR